jgi:hypothetical protein
VAEPAIFPKPWVKLTNKPEVQSSTAVFKMTDDLKDLIAYQTKKAQEVQMAIDSRDIYDVFLERASSNYVTKSSAINWLSEVHDVDLYSIEDARKINLKIDLDAFDNAVRTGAIEADMFEAEEGIENVTIDEDVDNDNVGDDVF